MNISIIGGGNLGTALAGEFATKGHRVILYSSRASLFNSRVTVVEDDREYLSEPFAVTDNLEYAIRAAQSPLIIITVPANGLKKIKDEMLLHIQTGSAILFMPGTGGVEYMFSEYVRRGIILLGLQRIPAVYRLIEPGKSVRISGRRKSGLFLGGIPSKAAGEYAPILAELFGMPCTALPNYLNVTLTPSNPILHTSRLYSMFMNYREGVFYHRNFLFYQEWDDSSSDVLLKCDGELQSLLRKIPELDLSYVKSLKEHYESNTKSEMTYKISHIRSFSGITSPMLEIEPGKWIPDFNSRYFTADFPYGLAIIKGLAVIFETAVPTIDTVLRWYCSVTKQEYYEGDIFSGRDLNCTGAPQKYGFTAKNDIVSIYE